MPERYQWQSALATRGIEARARTPVMRAGVAMCERQIGMQLAIRGEASKGAFNGAVSEVLGLELPTTPKTAHSDGANTVLWLGPDEWLVVSAAQYDGTLAIRLDEAMGTLHHAVVDVTHSRAVIGLEGPNARDVLMKGTNIDLHPRAFGPGHCIQAHLARTHMLLHQRDDAPSYDVYIHRSFAVYAWNWLSDAAGEYGLSIHGASSQ